MDFNIIFEISELMIIVGNQQLNNNQKRDKVIRLIASKYDLTEDDKNTIDLIIKLLIDINKRKIKYNKKLCC